MPWPTKGDYYNFKEEVIKHRAPAVSGVYGIYNFNHHILISHSNNIRESLLRHRKETKFHFRRLEPTGFTFEVCAPELKELRMIELTREYRPIVRPGEPIGLAALWRSWRTPSPRAFSPGMGASRQPAVIARRPSAPIEADKSNADKENVRRDQFALAGTGFALVVVVIALFVLLGENKNVTSSWTKQILSLAHHFTAFAEQGSPSESASRASQAVGTRDEIKPQVENPGRALETFAAPQVAGTVGSLEPVGGTTVLAPQIAAPERTDKTNAAAATTQNDPSRTEAVTDQRSPHAWTVQVLATTDRNDAITWLDRLKAKGYDAFIVGADVKGYHWYRVRVGNLSNFQEARTLEKTLQSKEGFHDAFVAHNMKSDVVLALNR